MESEDFKVRFISILSGFSSGILRTLVGHPFDTVKVLAQTNSNMVMSYKSLKVKELYRGILPPLISIGILTSLSFSVYENFRLSLLNYVQPSNDSKKAVVIFSAATLSGAALVLITSPLDNLKVIQQTIPNAERHNFTLRSFAFGKSSFSRFRGISSNMLVSSIGRGCYISAYLETQKLAVNIFKYKKNDILPKIVGASAAGVSGWLVLYPLDVVRSNMMSDYQQVKFKSTADCLRQIHSASGLKGLYKGLSYTLMRAVPVAICSLLSYDYTQQYLLNLLNE